MTWVACFGRWLITGFTIIFISGCAHSLRATNQADQQDLRWLGKLAITVHSLPAQAFSAEFELQGDAQRGSLTFFSPLGNTVARLQWDGDGAQLQSSGEAQRFESLDALTQHTTGTTLPVASLFEWLKGGDPDTPGWQVILQELPSGRLSARRFAPEPPVDLKVILER